MIVRIQNEEKFFKKFLRDIKKLNSRLDNPVIPDDLGVQTETFLVKGPEGFPVAFTREYRVFEVTLPEFEWKILKKFDHSDKITIEYNRDDPESIDHSHDDLINECKCDICKRNHNRKYTFLLKNTKTNEYIQTGSECLTKLIPEVACYYEEMLRLFDDMSDGFQWGTFTDSDCFSAKDALTNALLVFKFFNNCYETYKKNMSKSLALGIVRIDNHSNGDEDYEEASKNAEMIIAYINSCSYYNDYIRNLKYIAEKGSFFLRNWWLWCSSVCLLESAKKYSAKLEEKEKEKEAFSKESLEPGKTELVITKFIKEVVKEVDIGWRTTYTRKVHLLTENNNYVVLSVPDYNRAEEIENLLKEHSIKIKMTIKDSSEFNGIMYNFANRGKIIE